jgi:hypothetical protein
MPEHDWQAECRGLGYMILTIAKHYDSPDRQQLGGDSEFLASAIGSARRYVDGPLRNLLDGGTDV